MNHYTHLNFTERKKLQTYLEMKIGVKEIAKRLGRHRSSIYRELTRNQTHQTYSPFEAQKLKQQRLIGKRGKIETNPSLQAMILSRLKLGWSPEQISGRLRYEQYFDSVCHETIYRYIYRQRDKSLFHLLTLKRAKRQSQLGRKPHVKPPFTYDLKPLKKGIPLGIGKEIR